MSDNSRYVGAYRVRRDSLGKVLGTERFAADIKVPDALHLAVVRSTHDHARILSIDTGAATAMEGVERVFTARDVPGENNYGIIGLTKDQPMLADGVVRFKGEAVALVAATTEQIAQQAANLVDVEYEELPVIKCPAEALAEDAIAIHEKGNICFEHQTITGDVDKAFEEAAVVLEDTYRTSSIEHAYIETEAGFARMRDGVVEVTTSTQNPHYDRDDICRLLALPPEKVRIIQATTGGGFGGKLDLSVQPFLALATLLTGKATRLVYSREESFLCSAKRHPFEMHYKMGADKEGRIVALEANLIADTGAYASYALAVAMRAAVHAAGPYKIPNVKVLSRAIYTNRVFSGAMRGFGAPQVALAHESQIDRLATELGIDPLDIRKINAITPGECTITGQCLENSVGIGECLERIEKIRDEWREELAHDDDGFRGLGIGAMLYGIGNTGVSNPSTAQVEIDTGGEVTLFTGCADLGQGSDHTLLTILAETLNLAPEKINIVRGDTGRTTNAGATSASRQTYISGGAVLDAATKMRDAIIDQAASELGRKPETLALEDSKVVSRETGKTLMNVGEVVESLGLDSGVLRHHGVFDPVTTALDHKTGKGSPYGTYAYAAQVAQVHVDRATGELKVERLAAVHDVGRAISPTGVIGQINGGVVMGVGMALMEEFTPGSDSNLDTYLVPTMLDVPEITASFIEHNEPTGPYGAKGVGEPTLIPTAPAIINAIADAIGVRINTLPANLERVLEALQQKGEV